MSTQPEALRLANALETFHNPNDKQAAAELRRLHASCEDYAQHKQRQDQRVLELNAQRDALLEALLRIESAVDWYLGRSSFTQTTQLKGLKHSANVRKELFAAHDEVRAAIKAVGETK